MSFYPTLFVDSFPIGIAFPHNVAFALSCPLTCPLEKVETQLDIQFTTIMLPECEVVFALVPRGTRF